MEFKLPDIGEGVAEGEITKWLVKAGESVKADQPMVEVMTDKATVEIPSPMNGTIDELLANEGETVPVGQAIVRIAGAGDSAVKKPSNGGAHAPQDRPVSQPAPTKSAATKSAPARPCPSRCSRACPACSSSTRRSTSTLRARPS